RDRRDRGARGGARDRGGRGRRGRGAAGPARLRRSPRPPPGPGPGAQGGPRDGHPLRGRRRLLRGDRDGEHLAADRLAGAPPLGWGAVLGSVRDRAGREASIPIGFVANVTRGMAGQELSEMAELSEAGAIGFSDDGLPIADARVLRRALQYQRLAGGVIAL